MNTTKKTYLPIDGAIVKMKRHNFWIIKDEKGNIIDQSAHHPQGSFETVLTNILRTEADEELAIQYHPYNFETGIIPMFYIKIDLPQRYAIRPKVRSQRKEHASNHNLFSNNITNKIKETNKHILDSRLQKTIEQQLLTNELEKQDLNTKLYLTLYKQRLDFKEQLLIAKEQEVLEREHRVHQRQQELNIMVKQKEEELQHLIKKLPKALGYINSLFK